MEKMDEDEVKSRTFMIERCIDDLAQTAKKSSLELSTKEHFSYLGDIMKDTYRETPNKALGALKAPFEALAYDSFMTGMRTYFRIKDLS